MRPGNTDIHRDTRADLIDFVRVNTHGRRPETLPDNAIESFPHLRGELLGIVHLKIRKNIL